MPDPKVAGIGDADTARPNPARMYDYFLGGKDNYAADRRAAEEILKVAPETADLVRENRAFLRRAVQTLIDEGVRQFLDIGTGLPVQGNVPEIVAGAAPDARVVCVDNDPVACAHARALTRGGVPVLEADMRDPGAILAAAPGLLDLSEPIGLILAAVLHFVPDDRLALDIVARFRDAVAPGSFLVLSHGTQDGLTEEVEKEGLRVYRRSTAPTRLRTPEEVAGFFDGFALLEPGLVNVAAWRPDVLVKPRTGAYMLGGVARRTA